jgi:hypothetical protein
VNTPEEMLDTKEEDALGGVEVGSEILDVEDDAKGTDGVGSAIPDEDRLVHPDEEVEEVGKIGCAADELGTSERLVVDAAVGKTVVYDVMTTTGGTCKELDGETSAGAFDARRADS